ncbi:recombinase family protein [Actinacidiphila glaucinigra]|uniref:recombinase family protein n=1 Tax=Actinacidiphila glaucinigra TaxID=235986 RepID=UPI00366A9538
MFSLTEQLMVGSEFADKYAIEVVAVIEDRGESGGTFEKRKMATVFGMIREGQANIVLVADRSRFGRGGIQLNQAWEKKLNEAGGYLIAVKNPTDITTAQGRTQRDTDDFVAQITRNNIGDHWQRTHERRWKDELPHTGAPRMGYKLCEKCTLHEQTLESGRIMRRIIKRCGECDGALQVDEFRGDALAEFARRWTDGGESSRKLTVEMRERGVTSVRGNAMSERQWFAALDTGFGWGWRRRRTIPATGRGLTMKYPNDKPDTFDVWEKGKHKPVITDADGNGDLELWERYKAKRCGKPGVAATHGNKVKHSLSTRLRCGRPKAGETSELCMSPMVASKSRSGPKGTKSYVGTYACRAVREKLCRGITVSRHLAENAVKEWLEDQATNEERGREAAKAAAARDRRASNLEELEREVERLQRKLSKLTDLQLDDEAALHPTAFKLKQSEIMAELEPVQAQAEHLREVSRMAQDIPSASKFRRFADAWDHMHAHEKRALVETLIDHILVVKQPGKKNNQLVVVPYWEVGQGQESRPDAHLAACG